MGKIENEYPQPDWKKLFVMFLEIMTGLVICALISSCKTHEPLVSERSRQDSVWTVKVVQNGHGDSIVYKERMIVVPRMVHVGDTTLLSMDTTIYKYTERTITNNNNYYYDNGRAVKDSANVEKKNESHSKATHDKEHSKWILLWHDVIIGVIIALIVSIIINRKSIFKRIRQLISRKN